MSETFKFSTNIPLTFTPKFDKGIERDPPPEHPEYGKSFSWGVTVNGGDGYINMTPILNDKVMNASVKAGVPVTVTKIDEGGKSGWKVEVASQATAAPVVNETAEPAPVPQSAPQAPTQSNTAPHGDSKSRWITMLALLKFTEPTAPVYGKVTQAFQMERLIRKGFELQDKNGEVTPQQIEDIQNSPEQAALEKGVNELFGSTN